MDGRAGPLGYRPHERTLVIDEDAAEQARAIFGRYLQLGSVNVLRRELEAAGVRTRSGAVFQRGQLYHLLKNRTYLGEIKHRELTYPGLHPPLIDRALFEAVQARLAETVVERGCRPTSAASALLKGRLFDAAGCAMTPVFTHRGSRVYRYSASASLQRGETAAPHADLRRAPAPALDTFVAEQMARITGEGDEAALRLLRAELRSAAIHLLLRPDPSADITLKTIMSRLAAGEQASAEEDFTRVVLPVRFSRRGGRHWLHAPDGRTAEKPRLDPRLVRSLRASKTLRSRIERDEALTSTHHRRLAGLAFAAPAIQSAILNGTQPPGLTLEDLTRICEPLLWSEQVEALRRL